ncbi:MAG: YceH family protein [Pyrinomonadaceae bacterium]
MPEALSETEVRILGSLVEKQLTTPEYYPLTLNALVAACNQKTNRDPVVAYDETTVTAALESLREKNLVYVFYGAGSRTVKYKHMLPGVYELDPAETAVVAVLMLRGPQTLGEIKERAHRMHDFANLGEAQEVLDRLATRDDPVVVRLERQPGQKDARYAHLLAGPVDAAAVAQPSRSAGTSGVAAERIERLETEIAELRAELAEIRETFEQFRRQFE